MLLCIPPHWAYLVNMYRPGPNDLLIRLNTTGLCYSDIHFMLGDLGMPPMSTFGVRSPGHEGAGVVVAMGDNVSGWKLGDRAGMKPVYDVCHQCELCWGDKETYCEKAIHTGLLVTGTCPLSSLHPALPPMSSPKLTHILRFLPAIHRPPRPLRLTHPRRRRRHHRRAHHVLSQHHLPLHRRI